MCNDNESRICFVLQCKTDSGEDTVSVFWNKKDARNCMIEELKTEIANLQDIGCELISSVYDNCAELRIDYFDIYFEWEIIKTDIK